MWLAFEPCASWHCVHWPDFRTACTFGLSRPIDFGSWHLRQSALPCSLSRSLGTMPCRRWHSSHLPSLTLWCLTLRGFTFSANFWWQSRHSFFLKDCAWTAEEASSAAALRSQSLGAVTIAIGLCRS